MSFLRFTSPSERPVSRILLDIGPASVAGACAAYMPGKPPLLCYDKRVPIIGRVEELPEAAMERALDLVCEALEREGIPALTQATGETRVASAIVSIDAPWQQTIAHTEEMREERPFKFTERTLTNILERSRAALTEDPNRSIEQHVVGIRLNGYESSEPFGKMAHRAALIILISWIQARVASTIDALIRKRFRISRPAHVSGPSLRYQVLSTAFPDLHDVLILDAAGHSAALSLVRAHTLVAIQEFPGGESDESWIGAVGVALRELAESYPLPHTILLVADATEASPRARALESAGLGALWLSDNPPKIIPVSSVSETQVETAKEAVPDIRLALMTHYGALSTPRA